MIIRGRLVHCFATRLSCELLSFTRITLRELNFHYGKCFLKHHSAEFFRVFRLRTVPILTINEQLNPITEIIRRDIYLTRGEHERRMS